MKKLVVLFAAGILLFAACQKTATHEEPVLPEEEIVSDARKCAANEVLEEQLKADPGLRQRMDEIETFTRRFVDNPAISRIVGDVMEVPVVVNVLYNTTAQNISNEQIESQISIINADFAATNSDYGNTPAIFQGVLSGNTKIRFVLEGTNRKFTSKASWTTNDAMKKSSQGGIDPTNPTTTLNMWVCNLGGGILGYAQFPGGSSTTDGIVLDDNATGNTGTAAAPYGLGRTATHEIGHYFNLRHIWGDTRCGNDFVDDTPLHDAANYGCPPDGHKSKCKGRNIEMTMNYMDYTDDACMYMFTADQKSRMQAVFQSGGPRNSFAQ